MSQSNTVSWFEIYVEDMDRAKAFYETVLDRKLEDMTMPENPETIMMAFPWVDDAPGAAGALIKSETHKPSSSGTIIYFDSVDCTTELDRVEEAGGKILLPKTVAGESGFFCMFSDTEGNTVGCFSRA